MDMKVVRVTRDFACSAQLGMDDVARVAALGFKTIINNRPDGEGGGSQPTSNELERAALRHGMHYRHLPIVSPQMAGGAAVQFARVLESSPQPGGHRSAGLG